MDGDDVLNIGERPTVVRPEEEAMFTEACELIWQRALLLIDKMNVCRPSRAWSAWSMVYGAERWVACASDSAVDDFQDQDAENSLGVLQLDLPLKLEPLMLTLRRAHCAALILPPSEGTFSEEAGDLTVVAYHRNWNKKSANRATITDLGVVVRLSAVCRCKTD